TEGLTETAAPILGLYIGTVPDAVAWVAFESHRKPVKRFTCNRDLDDAFSALASSSFARSATSFGMSGEASASFAYKAATSGEPAAKYRDASSRRILSSFGFWRRILSSATIAALVCPASAAARA